MNTPKYLFDENMPHRTLRTLLLRQVPDMEIWAIGQEGAPSISTLDPDILDWIEQNQCLLVTQNRASMPVHLQDHLAKGQHVPGILTVPTYMSIAQIVEVLVLIWGASLPDEFKDQIVYIKPV